MGYRKYSIDAMKVKADAMAEKEAETVWLRGQECRALLHELAQPTSDPTDSITATSIQDYLCQRGAAVAATNPAALRVLSSLVTNPLTLAYGLHHIFPHYKDTIRVTALGMRSESHLPMNWWREALFLTTCVDNIYMDIIGPEMSTKHDQMSCAFHVNKTNTLRTLSMTATHDNQTTFHNHQNVHHKLLATDLFMLYNPGIGASDIMTRQWLDTMRLLLQSRKPVICTSHSEVDLMRDLKVLEEISGEEDHEEFGEPLEMLLPPHENPYRAYGRSFDGNESKAGYVVSSNRYIFGFRMK